MDGKGRWIPQTVIDHTAWPPGNYGGTSIILRHTPSCDASEPVIRDRTDKRVAALGQF